VPQQSMLITKRKS